jgi:carbon-monoxide dehydrogenase large subunit
MGQGLETTMVQVAAQVLGLSTADVSVSWTDTSQAPISLTGARASRSATVTGGAVARASQDVRRQILEVAAAKLEIEPIDLLIDEGSLYVVGEAQPKLSIAETVRAGFFDVTLPDRERDHTFEATHHYDPSATYSNACVIAMVDVDPATGAVSIRQIIGVEDCGTIINPMIVEGQFVGAVAQAIGSALFDRLQYNSDGQPTTSTLMDYLLPTAQENIRVTIDHLETTAEQNEHGIKGVGESGVIGTVAAIACAVADALGPAAGEVCQLPMHPAEIAALLQRDREVSGEGAAP